MKVGFFKPWLYAAPMLVAVAAVYFYPMVQLVRYSLQNVSTSPYLPSTYVGLDNFRFDGPTAPSAPRSRTTSSCFWRYRSWSCWRC